MATRALNPVATVVNPAAVGPVSDVSIPTVTDFAVTPGALLLPLETAAPPPVAVLEPLEHAAIVSAARAVAPTSMAARLLCLVLVTMDVSWLLTCADPAPATRVVKNGLVMTGITLAA
jgi:hypothetical protein